MRYLILIIAFILIPNVFFAQQTYVPDDNFEQALIDLRYDEGELNDSVPTANIETVEELEIRSYNISDLTGIEDFKNLEALICPENNLTNLDVSYNSALEILDCRANRLTSLDLSNNAVLKHLGCSDNELKIFDVSNNSDLQTLYCGKNALTSLNVNNNAALKWLYCDYNNLTSLDLSKNTVLGRLFCYENELTSLDLSNNSALKILYCFNNGLTSLNIKNGNNKNMTGDLWDDYFTATSNPDLYCIQVDDSSWSANANKWKKDDQAHYSEDCTKVGVEEFNSLEPVISIFPNPAGKYFTVSFELETPKTIHLALTDLSGSELQEFSLENKQYVNEEIDVSMLSSGVYFLRIDFGGGSISRKIVVE